MISRRSFIGTAALLPALRASTREQRSAPPGLDPWVEVNRAHLAQNVAQVAKAVGRPIIAVIKNNGYGLGVTNLASVLGPMPQVHALAVVKLHEAVQVRDAGVKAPILMMGPFEERDLDVMTARDIMPMVYTPIGAGLERSASRASRPLKVHVKVDTGLGRVGVPYRDAVTLVQDLASRKNVVIDGLMMTFTEDLEFDREQARRFDQLGLELKQRGITAGMRHSASTYTLFQHPGIVLDAVRPGMALLGVYPEPAFRASKRMTLVPAGALRARVAYVKQLRAGESAGYERAFVAQRDTWVATLPVGHADGWPRAAAKGARVRINGVHYPVIASVSASHTILDIGDKPAVAIGDVATMWDWEEGSRPEDVSASCGASVYDLLMHLGGQMPRVVV